MSEVVLWMWPAVDGLESSSPYCLKTLYALRYKKIPYRVEYPTKGFPEWVTTGKLPAAEVYGERLEDSTSILKAIDRLPSEASPLYPVFGIRRRKIVMLEDWADEALTINMVYYRWTNDETFKKFAAQAFKGAPVEMMNMARQFHFEHFRDRGIATLTDQERLARYEDAIGYLSDRLESAHFIVGDGPTAADFAIYPSLEITFAANIPELIPVLQKYSRVTEWMERFKSKIPLA